MWGYESPEDLLADTGFLVHNAYVDPELRHQFAQQLEEEGEITGFEVQLRRKDEGTFWVSLNARVVRDEQGNVLHYEGTAEDITARRDAQKQIEASLHEKEVLLKEIHHRVKNNLQVISSLLNMQSQYANDPMDIDLFRSSIDRIKSMALIHDKLYRSENLARIYFHDYVRLLADDLCHAYAFGKNIAIKVDAEPISLDIDNALPLGLIINELVSNSLKHAFPDRRDGNLRLHLSSVGKEITLTVADNGVGFPEGTAFPGTKTLGLQLVATLVEQLEGTITLDNTAGAAFTIRFEQTD